MSNHFFPFLGFFTFNSSHSYTTYVFETFFRLSLGKRRGMIIFGSIATLVAVTHSPDRIPRPRCRKNYEEPSSCSWSPTPYRVRRLWDLSRWWSCETACQWTCSSWRRYHVACWSPSRWYRLVVNQNLEKEITFKKTKKGILTRILMRCRMTIETSLSFIHNFNDWNMFFPILSFCLVKWERYEPAIAFLTTRTTEFHKTSGSISTQPGWGVSNWTSKRDKVRLQFYEHSLLLTDEKSWVNKKFPSCFFSKNQMRFTIYF